MRWRLLLFDLDGTLADTEEDLAGAVNATRAWAGLAPLPLEAVRAAVGDGAHVLIARTVPFQGPVEEPLRHFIGVYGTRCTGRTRLYPGIAEALEATRDRVRCVVTNKPEHISRRILERLGVDGHFADVIGGGTLPARKPDPGAVRILLERHGMAPADAVLIGDSPVDVETARAAGIASVALASGYAARADLQAAGPDHILENALCLKALLEGL